MSFNEHNNISPDFADLFSFSSEKEELKHDAKMIMFRFLSEIDRMSENELLQKDYAAAMKTSASFVNQLFKGDKLANLVTIAKLQKAFNVIFDIKAIPAIQQSFEVPVSNSVFKMKANSLVSTNAEPAGLTFVPGGKYSNTTLKTEVA
jgi:hypothetical protein